MTNNDIQLELDLKYRGGAVTGGLVRSALNRDVGAWFGGCLPQQARPHSVE